MKLEVAGYDHIFIDAERPQDVYTVHLYYMSKDHCSIYVCGPSRNKEETFVTYLEEQFSSIEKALEKFNDICEHIEDYVKENEND